MFWLGVTAQAFYQTRLGHLLAADVYWPAAMVFYALYIAGILLFAVIPGLRSSSLFKTLLHAGAFGIFTYMTYELTNMATLPNWPLSIVLVDTDWGVVLCCAVGASAYGIASSSPNMATLMRGARQRYDLVFRGFRAPRTASSEEVSNTPHGNYQLSTQAAELC